jgi:mRNA interferase RelE/StbE
LYEVIFTRRARKSMSRFPRREYERVLRAIESLAEVPKPSGARKIRGTGNLGDWRIRFGRDYRVIYRLAV